MWLENVENAAFPLFSCYLHKFWPMYLVMFCTDICKSRVWDSKNYLGLFSTCLCSHFKCKLTTSWATTNLFSKKAITNIRFCIFLQLNCWLFHIMCNNHELDVSKSSSSTPAVGTKAFRLGTIPDNGTVIITKCVQIAIFSSRAKGLKLLAPWACLYSLTCHIQFMSVSQGLNWADFLRLIYLLLTWIS